MYDFKVFNGYLFSNNFQMVERRLYVQRRIYNPVERLQWNFFAKIGND